MAHQYEATLGGAHTEHVHVLNVHSPIQTLYCYIYEHVLQWQVIKWTTLCRKQSAI